MVHYIKLNIIFLNINTSVQNYNETILLEHVNLMHWKTISDIYTSMIQQLHIFFVLILKRVILNSDEQFIKKDFIRENFYLLK